MHLLIDILGRPWLEAISTPGFFASQSSSPVVAFVIARDTLISMNRIPSQSRIPRELFTPFDRESRERTTGSSIGRRRFVSRSFDDEMWLKNASTTRKIVLKRSYD